jgi:hypothetical protein
MTRKKKREPAAPLGTALTAEQDRGCILVGCAYLEHQLELLLGNHLEAIASTRQHSDAFTSELIRRIIDSRDPQALLSSGWAKSAILYLSGVINRFAYDGFDEIRKIRNECAHHPGTITLDASLTSGLMKRIEELDPNMHREIIIQAERYNAGAVTIWSELGGHNRFSGPRIKFMHACINVDAPIDCMHALY